MDSIGTLLRTPRQAGGGAAVPEPSTDGKRRRLAALGS